METQSDDAKNILNFYNSRDISCSKFFYIVDLLILDLPTLGPHNPFVLDKHWALPSRGYFQNSAPRPLLPTPHKHMTIKNNIGI